MDLTISPLVPATWPALEDLFGKAGASNGCWCMYWRIGPRYHDRPREQNKHDLQQLAATEQPPGLLAFDGNTAVGWCELGPRAELGWLTHARHLQPVDDLPVWSIPCFYVRRTHRGQGVMGALIDAALPAAASAGAPALEAYPSTRQCLRTPAIYSLASHRPSPIADSKSWPAARQTVP